MSADGKVQGLVYQVLVVRLLGRLEEQGGVGGRVLRPVLGDGFEIARVGHDRRVLLQRFEKIHGVTSGGGRSDEPSRSWAAPFVPCGLVS
jgi:hypothetical protein